MTAQDKIAQAIYKMQNKLFDTSISVTGTEIETILLEVHEDRFNNRETTITSSSPITVVIDFPNNEIPTSICSTDDNTDTNSNQVLHLYDILPITAHFKSETIKNGAILLGSIILYKIKNRDGKFQTIAFRIIDAISKGNISAIMWQEYVIAPVTDYALLQNQDYLDIVTAFENRNIW